MDPTACQVFLYNDVLDCTVGAYLASPVVSTTGCAVAAMLYNRGVVSANTARRLRNASVVYSSAIAIASPVVAQLAGVLANSALQLLRAAFVPYGLGVGFVVVSIVFNKIYVFDDVKFVPIQWQLSPFTPFPAELNCWSIVKRPEQTMSVLKRIAHATRGNVHESGSANQNFPVAALTSRNEKQKDESFMNAALAIIFAVASAYYAQAAWQSKKSMILQMAKGTPIPKQIFIESVLSQLQRARKQGFVVSKINTPHKLSPPHMAGRWALQSSLLMNPRMRWAIATTALVALQLAHQHPIQESQGWLTKADVDEY